MPRYARPHAPTVVHHIIGRFVNGAFRLNKPHERAEYLRRLALALARTDWRVLAYALMSNHVHLACLAGQDASERLIKSTHVGFAQWLNTEQDCFGPLFAERHTTVLVPSERVCYLISYIHANVVRAGVVANPLESPWTSHAAYAGVQQPPPWLDRDLGLELTGLGATAAGRADFHEFTLAHAADPRDPQLSDDAHELRKRVRRLLGAPVEVSSAQLVKDEATTRASKILARPGVELRPRWTGLPGRVALLVAKHCGITVELMRSRDRRREVVAGRRLALVVWVAHLGRAPGEMSDFLTMSSAGASHLLNRDAEAVARLAHEAELIAALCWAEKPEELRSESKEGRTVPT